MWKRSILLAVAVLSVLSCSMQKRISGIGRDSDGIVLKLSENDFLPDIVGSSPQMHKDTLTVKDEDGKEIIIMKAVRDENGEMVANDVIDAAIVTARFRNIAERHGKVDLRFLVTVPASMLDSRWQLRLTPEMRLFDDEVSLDPVIITGRDYRKAQLRGYQQYERFLNSIVTDTTEFIRMHELEVFLHRNIPALYSLKTDTTYVSDEQFSSIYGVTERQAVEHYTNQFAVEWNRRKVERKDRMFDRYVKVPIVTEGLRLDTVITAGNGDFVYEYVQTINTAPELRKVDIALSGGIYEEEKGIYTIPENSPITFYISSLSSLLEENERYLTRIIERKAVANSTCWIDFEQGKSDIKPGLGANGTEIGRIKQNLSSLLENRDFDLDSIIVTASCSPEGSWASNDALSKRRSASVSEYFDRYIRHCRDSISRERGIFLSLDGSRRRTDEPSGQIPFISRNIPENWDRLVSLVSEDEMINGEERSDIIEKMLIKDFDLREKALSGTPYYQHLREVVYPKLRTVRFDFHLHRKGMIKDTVHTTVLDTVYMRGLQAVKDRDYKTAVTLLRPYGDYNTAVAYTCMDYNESALSILENLKRNAQVNYLLAVVYSRKGMAQEALQCFSDACRENPSYVHRGNLDPEISGLLKQYDFQPINNQSLEL